MLRKKRKTWSGGVERDWRSRKNIHPELSVFSGMYTSKWGGLKNKEPKFEESAKTSLEVKAGRLVCLRWEEITQGDEGWERWKEFQ